MTDLRKAAEMALEVFEHLSKGESPAITRGELVYEIAALRQALEEPEQEPAAWMDKNSGVVGRLHQWENAIPLYTAPPKREWKCRHCGETND